MTRWPGVITIRSVATTPMQTEPVRARSANTPPYLSRKWSDAASTTCPADVTARPNASRTMPTQTDTSTAGLRSAPSRAAEERESLQPRERVRVVVTTCLLKAMTIRRNLRATHDSFGLCDGASCGYTVARKAWVKTGLPFEGIP